MTAQTRYEKVRRGFAAGFVIVISVMVALAGDSYVESREEHRLESTYLRALLNDVDADIEALDVRLSSFQERIEGQLGVYYVVRDQEPVADSVAFLRGLWAAANYGTFDARTATFEDLRSTGRLRLVSDPALRDQVLEYYMRVADVVEMDAAHREQVLAAFRQYLVPALDGIGLSLASRSNRVGQFTPEPPDAGLERTEAAQAFATFDSSDIANMGRFVTVAGALMTKSRAGFGNLRLDAVALRDAISRAVDAGG